MRKIKTLLVAVLILSPLFRLEADTRALESPAHLLPADTSIYMDGEIFFGKQAWMGERMAWAVFPPYVADESLWDFLPSTTLLIEVSDEQAADDFVNSFANGWEYWQGSGVRIWRLPILIAVLRVDGYLVIGETRGIEHIAKTIFRGRDSLAEDHDFARIKNALAPNPSLWGFNRWLDSGLAFDLAEDRVMLETVHLGEPADRVAAPLTTEAVAGVPTGALFVDAGMNLDIPLQTAVDALNELVAQIAAADESLQGLPLQLDALVRTAIGVDIEDDLIPLFDGGYALYLADDLNGGLILSPQNPDDVAFTLTRLTNRLEQNLGLSAEITGQLEYTLSGISYGFAEDRLYVSTVSGAERILQTLEGVSISNDSRWRRALDDAPEGTQHMTFINVRAGIDLLAIWAAEEIGSPLLDELLNSLKIFESIAIYQREDADGLQLTRYALLLDN